MLMGLDYNDKVDIFSYGIFLAGKLSAFEVGANA